jgi:acyl-coenzyme A synthetase/AMP-(fatty) acid ligase
VPRAYVVAGDRPGDPGRLARQLQEFVRARLSPHKYPREFRFVEELPKTASGKLDRKALRTPTQSVLEGE